MTEAEKKAARDARYAARKSAQGPLSLIPLELIDTADLPDGGTLRLMRRGGIIRSCSAATS